MKETSSDPPDIDPQRTGARPNAYGSSSHSRTRSDGNSLPVTQPTDVASHGSNKNKNKNESNSNNNSSNHAGAGSDSFFPASPALNTNLDNGLPNGHLSPSAAAGAKSPIKNSHGVSPVNTASRSPKPASSPKDEGQGIVLDTKHEQDNNDLNQTNSEGEGSSQKKQRTFVERTRRTLWLITTHSWLNLLLVFVPVGIITANIDSIPGGVVFAMNCIAVIPLAGLLAHATESVAANMGDALGALLNVTFGNAVELIIFIALAKDKIRIVQASLLGSILANLLMILGMGFFLGGLRYREQIYNSTVTQMSACLLSLSVISLVLPTAFFQSFKDEEKAMTESLKVSRGTSVILLLVYVVYLLFQLKSHAYLYESTPQHIVDAESTPGPAAGWLDSSSDSDSSSSSDSDSSGHSHDTVRRKMKKVLRAGRRRKSSNASVDTADLNFMRANASPNEEAGSEASSSRPNISPAMQSGDLFDDDLEDEKLSKRNLKLKARHRRHRRAKKRSKRDADGADIQPTINEGPENIADSRQQGEPRRVDFALPVEEAAGAESGTESRPGTGGPRRPFPALRGMSVKALAPSVFVHKPETGQNDVPADTAGSVPRVRYGIRRTNSLPDRLNDSQQRAIRPPGAMLPAQLPLRALSNGVGGAAADENEREDSEDLSRWASIILLLIVTALVAVCAEFLVGSIEAVTESSSISEMFIGLIILPIVGNAAEHVTAVTVAMKNKVDLAIGVAVGSSIQIAIFVTPLIVILGWILDKDMTLHFTLFETVCLFVSAFIVNFLVLDGRSNYLEGALLCAVYLIIAIAAYFYPDSNEQAANS